MTTRSLLSFLPGELLLVWPLNTADYVATLPLGLLDFLVPSSAAFTFTLSSACQEFVLQVEMALRLGELEATLDVTSMVSIGRDDRVGYGSGGSVGWRK